jgi:hypothetical protein
MLAIPHSLLFSFIFSSDSILTDGGYLKCQVYLSCFEWVG